ncbi:MAG TPA: hypothetical protein VGD79_01340 [Thermoanaerobaculia bacterium]
MKTRTEKRVDYQWRADREGGFEKATLIYDREGRLMAVDYPPAAPAECRSAATRVAALVPER